MGAACIKNKEPVKAIKQIIQITMKPSIFATPKRSFNIIGTLAVCCDDGSAPSLFKLGSYKYLLNDY